MSEIVTPLMIDLDKKNIVIVGGGSIAERRIRSLLKSGGLLTVISPTIGEGIQKLWQTAQLTWKKKRFEAVDLADAFLIIAATNDPTVNELVVHHSPQDALLNVAAQAEKGNIHFPAHFKQGKLSISISTDGASPMLAAKIKGNLHTVYDENYGDYVDFLNESRKLIKHSLLDKSTQSLLLKELLAESFMDEQKQTKTIAWLEKLSGKDRVG